MGLNLKLPVAAPTGERTIYLPDLDGALLAEYESDGVRPACPDGGGTNCRTAFLKTDHLGSTWAVTDASEEPD